MPSLDNITFKCNTWDIKSVPIWTEMIKQSTRDLCSLLIEVRLNMFSNFGADLIESILSMNLNAIVPDIRLSFAHGYVFQTLTKDDIDAIFYRSEIQQHAIYELVDIKQEPGEDRSLDIVIRYRSR